MCQTLFRNFVIMVWYSCLRLLFSLNPIPIIDTWDNLIYSLYFSKYGYSSTSYSPGPHIWLAKSKILDPSLSLALTPVKLCQDILHMLFYGTAPYLGQKGWVLTEFWPNEIPQPNGWWNNMWNPCENPLLAQDGRRILGMSLSPFFSSIILPLSPSPNLL